MKENAEYDIPVIKSQRYSIDEIFEKNLLFLIPFYIFSHESRFKKYESDTAMYNVPYKVDRYLNMKQSE